MPEGPAIRNKAHPSPTNITVSGLRIRTLGFTGLRDQDLGFQRMLHQPSLLLPGSLALQSGKRGLNNIGLRGAHMGWLTRIVYGSQGYITGYYRQALRRLRSMSFHIHCLPQVGTGYRYVYNNKNEK